MVHTVDTCTAMRRSLRAFIMLIFSDMLRTREFNSKTYRVSEVQIDYKLSCVQDICVMGIIVVLISTEQIEDLEFESKKEYHKLGQFNIGAQISPDTAIEIRTACRRVVTKLMLLHS